MIFFVLIVLSIYGSMHALVYWGISPLILHHPKGKLGIWIWMGLMTVAPVLTRVFERYGFELVARLLAVVGFVWMGFLWLAFSLFALVGIWELLVWILSKGFSTLSRLSVHGPLLATIGLIVVIGTGLYGFYEAAHVKVEKIQIKSSKLKDRPHPLRIVQISDLHLDLLQCEKTLQSLLSQIKDLQPDVLVATGDIIDAQTHHLDTLSELWRGFSPPLGKLAVFGNHEAYVGVEQSLDFLQKSGFTVLRNQSTVLENRIKVIGIDEDSLPLKSEEEISLLKQQQSDQFTLVLKHRPMVQPNATGLFDLQLSGHAHGGQIFPFHLFTWMAFPMQNGLYSLPHDTNLYASRGTGTWGPPMRVLSPPEITLFEIVPKGP
ncbi:hypothetical protein BVX98_06590 [bacterium F11]|nr:hypothetical protein BVX98_06590 [bacterium F11]